MRIISLQLLFPLVYQIKLLNRRSHRSYHTVPHHVAPQSTMAETALRVAILEYLQKQAAKPTEGTTPEAVEVRPFLLHLPSQISLCLF